MNEEDLYKLAISDVSKYSLLNEILAIRDNRFPNEENDYTIKVYGSISLDVLNRYVRNINELEQLQNNWNELNKFIEEEKNRLATQVSNTYEDSLGKRRFVNEDIFNELTKVSEKMQELENDKEC